MQLREVVGDYLELAGGYGRPVPLGAFAWLPEETEKTFSLFDEDYHISRFFHFSNRSGPTYRINGFEHTHVSIDAEIESIL